eukprot:8993760-Lingulodinium_polyedra.AAC.1
MCHAFPTKRRTTEDTIEAFKTFVGSCPHHVFKMYSDMGREIVSTLQEYHVLHQHGQPGLHKTNAEVERANREILDRSRTHLDGA